MPHLLLKLLPVQLIWYAEQRVGIKNVLPATAVDNGKFKAFWMKCDERIWCVKFLFENEVLGLGLKT